MTTLLTIKFDRLNKNEFAALLEFVQDRKTGLGIWGDPIQVGPRSVHIYGAISGAWVPVNVEIGESSVVFVFSGREDKGILNSIVVKLRKHISGKIRVWFDSEEQNGKEKNRNNQTGRHVQSVQ